MGNKIWQCLLVGFLAGGEHFSVVVTRIAGVEMLFIASRMWVA
jgi:hypothetical protein